jgi:hypothetical protein
MKKVVSVFELCANGNDLRFYGHVRGIVAETPHDATRRLWLGQADGALSLPWSPWRAAYIERINRHANFFAYRLEDMYGVPILSFDRARKDAASQNSLIFMLKTSDEAKKLTEKYEADRRMAPFLSRTDHAPG